MKKVAFNLITSETVLYSVGTFLHLQTNEITWIQTDNPRNIRKAGEVILHEWIRSSGITEFKDVNESLGKSFSFSKLAGAFADISAGKMRKILIGKVVFIYTLISFVVMIFKIFL